MAGGGAAVEGEGVGESEATVTPDGGVELATSLEVGMALSALGAGVDEEGVGAVSSVVGVGAAEEGTGVGESEATVTPVGSSF